MSKIKAVVFDVGGVLMYWSRRAIYEDLKRELGFNDQTIDIFWKKYVHPFGKGKVSEAELWRQASHELGIRLVKSDENLLGRTFARTIKPYKEVLEYAASLRNRGFKIAALSNTNEVHAKYMRRIGVFQPFDYVCLSNEVGVRKPDPKIYELVLEKLKVKPEETIFIDDTPEHVEAAKKMGMRPILARNPQKIIEDINTELGKDFVGTKLALINKGRVLAILRDNKPSINFPGHWDFPGGSREKNEKPEDVAIREIKEELNIEIRTDEIVWRKFWPAVTNPHNTASFMVIKLTDEQANSIVLGDEGQEWKYMTFDEFLNHPKAVGGMKLRLNDYLQKNKMKAS